LPRWVGNECWDSEHQVQAPTLSSAIESLPARPVPFAPLLDALDQREPSKPESRSQDRDSRVVEADHDPTRSHRFDKALVEFPDGFPIMLVVDGMTTASQGGSRPVGTPRNAETLSPYL
jgi:hypothetical protein